MSQTNNPAQGAIGINPLMPWTPQQIANNAAARTQILMTGKKMRQKVSSGSFVPVAGSGTTFSPVPAAVGLITKFVLEVIVTVTNPSTGGTLTRAANMAPYNILSNISYQNPSQFTPVNCPGWWLGMVQARRERKVPGAAITTDTPTGMGAVASSLAPIAAPASIAAGASGTVTCEYDIPLAFAARLGNFQGSVFGGSTLSVQNISATFNPNFVGTADTVGQNVTSVYTGADTSGANAPTYSAQWNLYQEYFDQWDTSLVAALTPDLSTSYYLTTQAQTGLVANSDNPVALAPLRTFLGVGLIYDENASGMNEGTDIDHFKLMSANQLPFWTRTPRQQHYLTRQWLGDDYPAGHYMIDFADHPVSTAAEGNTIVYMNPTAVPSGSVLTAGFEFLGVQSVIAGAPSIGA